MADQTPIEKAAAAIAEAYRGGSAIPHEGDVDLARAALTAALGSVEETARVLDPLAPWWLPIDHPQALHCRVARAQAEALHAHLLAGPDLLQSAPRLGTE